VPRFPSWRESNQSKYLLKETLKPPNGEETDAVPGVDVKMEDEHPTNMAKPGKIGMHFILS